MTFLTGCRLHADVLHRVNGRGVVYTGAVTFTTAAAAAAGRAGGAGCGRELCNADRVSRAESMAAVLRAGEGSRVVPDLVNQAVR